MERKGRESIKCWTNYLTLSFDRDLGLSRSNYSKYYCGQITLNIIAVPGKPLSSFISYVML